MKILYLDTSIIIAFLKKADIYYNISEKIMNTPTLERVGSAITILEIFSVISRQFEDIEFDEVKTPNWDSLNESAKKALVSSYFLFKLPIKFYFCLGNEKYNIKNQDYVINIDFTKAFRISPFFALRSLDGLQIASALNLRDIKNIHIDYFVTTDKIILDQGKDIQKSTNLTIIHPEKLIDIEHL